MVLIGTIGTGIAQGILSAVGFWIAGVPDPIFFGAATAVAAAAPGIVCRNDRRSMLLL